MSKKKKEKISYVDDGRTIADMTGVGAGSWLLKHNAYRPRSKAKDVWNTYWNAVKMMLVPMLAAICGIIIIYMLLSFIFLMM